MTERYVEDVLPSFYLSLPSSPSPPRADITSQPTSLPQMSVTWITRDTEAPVVQWWAAMPEEDRRRKGRRARTIRRQAKEGNSNCLTIKQYPQSPNNAKAESGGSAAIFSQPLDQTQVASYLDFSSFQ